MSKLRQRKKKDDMITEEEQEQIIQEFQDQDKLLNRSLMLLLSGCSLVLILVRQSLSSAGLLTVFALYVVKQSLHFRIVCVLSVGMGLVGLYQERDWLAVGQLSVLLLHVHTLAQIEYISQKIDQLKGSKYPLKGV
ncbi:hypothetical protein EDD86DRAFT_207719, partial [Gorgonomyces haynaldii]